MSKHGAVARLTVGLVQGALFFWLSHSVQQKAWPATEPVFYAPLSIAAIFVPLILLFGIGNLRPRTLLIWTGTALLILVGLALHDATRISPFDNLNGPMNGLLFLRSTFGGTPTFTLTAFVALGLFIAQSLITAADADRRLIATYPRYFDTAWKLELQLLLAALFVGLFWVLLYLGAGLLALIKIEFLSRLIRHAWFATPVTTLALAAAIHLTDMRASLVVGARTLIHVVLSWLLPTIAVIVAIFLISLPFTGLDPLWKTSHASALLLSVAAALIVLINTIYRDGGVELAAPRILRLGGSLAAVELVPLTIIAAWALGLRVAQHGWSVTRVYAAAATVVAVCYAAGYFLSTVRRGPWLKRLEACNITTSFVILAALLALLTPVADPARIAVASQVGRLLSGQVPSDAFDYGYLRWHGERYGKAALESLKAKGENDPVIAAGVSRAERATGPWAKVAIAPTEAELTAAITAYPAGKPLPQSFLSQKWPLDTQWSRPACLFNKATDCDAFQIDLDGDGIDEIVLMNSPHPFQATVFKANADGSWSAVGTLTGSFLCDGVLQAMRNGQFTLAPSPWKELNVAGRTFKLGPSLPDTRNCP